MIRVCSVIGTWQLVTLVASLKQAEADAKSSGKSGQYEDYLIMYETAGVPDEFKQILQRMAEAAWPWKKIVWAYDVLHSDFDVKQRDYARLLGTLQERVGVPAQNVGEVWVCWLTRPAEKLLFGAFPRAQIVLYEDGLISYLPIQMAERLPIPSDAPFPKSLRLAVKQGVMDLSPVRRFRHSGWELDPRHLARLSRAYLLLSPTEPLPQTIAHVPRVDVSDTHVRAVLQKIAQSRAGEIAQATANASGSAGRVLILGQALSRNHVMNRNDELAFYQSVVQTVLDKGYAVLWKEHPRISEPFFDDLQAFAVERLGVPAARMERLNLPHAFPVELVADKLNLAACVAGTSAALFYLARLYGIACTTFAGDLLPRMQGADVFMNDLVRRHIPPLADLPPNSAPTAPFLAEPPVIA